MNSQPHSDAVRIAALCVALAAVVYAVVHVYDPVIRPVLDVLPPFAIAFASAFLLDPVVDWIQSKGLSRGLGVAIVGASFLILFLLVGLAVVPRVADQARTLSRNFPDYSRQAQDALDGVLVRARPLLDRFHLPTTASGWTDKLTSQFGSAASGGLSVLAGSLSAAVSRILWVILIPLTTLWLLRDLDYLKAKIVHLTPSTHRDRLMRVSSAVGGVFGRYVRGMLAVAIIYSAATSIVLSLVGLNYALIIGGIAGIFYMVPYLGVVTLGAITAIAALVQPGMGPAYAGGLFVYILVQSFIAFDMLVTPRVVGGSVGVHPVLMLFSLALGARLFGVAGMIAAVPVAAACQVAIGQYYPEIYDRVKHVPLAERSSDETPQDSDEASA